MKKIILTILLPLLVVNALTGTVRNTGYFDMAKQTLNAVYELYKSPVDTFLLNETYPFNPKNVATYTVNENKVTKQRVAYLWPTSGMLSGVAAMLEVSGDAYYKKVIDKRVLPGLNKYFDTKREPHCYQSYINTEPQSDRFYDDNVWLVIDFTDLYAATGDKYYLKQAELVWQFVISGWDEQLKGGIYWCEQKKTSKNTCSNAPSVVAAAKLYRATRKTAYLDWSKKIYAWTKTNLQDSSDYLYFDNMNLQGKLDKRKFAYNSGQMIQGAALLYLLTSDKMYLEDARKTAKSAMSFFSKEIVKDNKSYKVNSKGNGWFYTVMARGIIELYEIDKNPVYLTFLQSNMEYIRQFARSSNGLFYSDWTGAHEDQYKWLLNQGCVIELAARLSKY